MTQCNDTVDKVARALCVVLEGRTSWNTHQRVIKDPASEPGYEWGDEENRRKIARNVVTMYRQMAQAAIDEMRSLR